MRFEIGFCQCGCGGKTRAADRDYPRYGYKVGDPYMFMRGHARRVPFELAYKIDPLTGCWNWLKSLNRDGYGQQFHNGALRAAHRVSYELHKAPIPNGKFLDHLCRNPRCVNPDHLEPVTNAENIRRGRTAKLSLDKAEEIRRLYRAGGINQTQLGKQFGVRQNVISKVISRQLWA